MSLTPAEQDLCRQIDFDPAVGELLKVTSGQPVEQLKGAVREDAEWGPVAGLAARTTEQGAQQILAGLEPQLPAGYSAYFSERNWRGDHEIAVLKTTNRFEIVRLKGTSAGNYDLATPDIVARLKQWQQVCKLRVVGAGHDWVFIEFETLPDDVSAFGQEIYEFCPDTIDQHFGCFGEMADAMDDEGEELPDDMRKLMDGLDWDDPDSAGMELLKASLQQNKSLFLWWD